MSGNYDHPPASRRASRGTGATDRPHRPNVARLQHLRDLLASERNRDSTSTARALEALNQEISESHPDHSRDHADFDQAREAVDRQIQQLQSDLAGRQERIRSIFVGYDRPGPAPATVNPAAMDQDPNPSGRPSRRRGTRGTERPGRDTRRETSLNPQLSGLSARLESSPAMSRDSESGRPVGRWRSKRRKLESDDNREGPRGFGYGQYGQVVPGMLKMEIASCDGGTYEPTGESSWPENVLRNDPSVYCTKSDRCNLVLRHRGEAPFCLKKIAIKAPKTGYDAPIQEGMVFVSMESDELLARTTQYRVQYSSAARRRRNRRGPLSQEYLNSVRSPLQSLEREALTNPDSRSDSGNDLANNAAPSGFSVPNTMAGFRVTTEYDENSGRGIDGDQENGDELPSAAEIERLHMEQAEDDFLCSDSDESDSDDATELSLFNRRRRELLRHIRELEEEAERERRRRDPTARDPPTTTPTSRYYPEFDSPNQELLRPNARFFIERSKSMVSIKFDPPPSGRFILIKLWSPHSGGNIDIQSIIAHGFAGPRFFPAGCLR